MKKIVSLIVLIAVLVWTWSLINGARSGSAETHAGIQDRMRELIALTIKEKRPTAEGLEINKLWTESLNERQIQVHFSYQFLDKSESGEIVETSVEGEAELDKQSTENPQLEQWALTKVKINNDQLVFQEGIVITPNKPLEINTNLSTESTTENPNTSLEVEDKTDKKVETSEVDQSTNKAKSKTSATLPNTNKQVAPAATGTNK